MVTPYINQQVDIRINNITQTLLEREAGMETRRLIIFHPSSDMQDQNQHGKKRCKTLKEQVQKLYTCTFASQNNLKIGSRTRCIRSEEPATSPDHHTALLSPMTPRQPLGSSTPPNSFCAPSKHTPSTITEPNLQQRNRKLGLKPPWPNLYSTYILQNPRTYIL